MPVHGLLAIVDDIAAAADDVAKMAAAATQRSAGVVIDDMAVTAGAMTGLNQDRETDFVVQVGRASMKNKLLYLVPAALAINAFVPSVMPWLLTAGGAFLAYEGTEKVVHAIQSRRKGHAHAAHTGLAHPVATVEELLAFEKKQVSDAIRTDLVLSAEIVAISLAATLTIPGFWLQAAALVLASIAMTIGVYGMVWLLVKIDDLGEWLKRKNSGAARKTGALLIAGAPGLFRTIGVVGTVAMLLVGGSLVMHGLHEVKAIEALAHGIEHAVDHALGKSAASATVLAMELVLALLVGLALIGVGATGLPSKFAGLFAKRPT